MGNVILRVQFVVGLLADGEARLTQDIDFVVDLPDDQVPDFCAAFPAPERYLRDIASILQVSGELVIATTFDSGRD